MFSVSFHEKRFAFLAIANQHLTHSKIHKRCTYRKQQSDIDIFQCNWMYQSWNSRPDNTESR
jgi:hypothetical protein